MDKNELVDLDGAVWLRRQALADGLSDHQITMLVRNGVWHRVRRGAYCAAELWHGLSEEDRHRVLCRAVLLAAHPSTVLSHTSAAVEHGIPVWGIPLGEVHTTRTDRKCARKEAGVVHHRGLLLEDDVQVVNGVRVTSPTRCAIEVCTISAVEPALVVTTGAVATGQAKLTDIEQLAKDTKHWPQSLNTRLVTDLVHPLLESVAEVRAWYLCWREHLPRPEPQVVVRDERGRFVARLDFAWPEHGVFLEVDGRAKYTKFRRRGESLDEFVLREKRREEQVCQLTGWVCVRVTWQDLGQPELLARRLRRILDQRAPQAG